MAPVAIPLRSKKYPGLVALVDESDAEAVLRRPWWVVKHSCGVLYAITFEQVDGRRRGAMMHRLILGVTDRSIQVDHLNHNGLDNRRANLRLATVQENQFHQKPRVGRTSRFKGVSWSRTNRRWHVEIRGREGRIYIGSFDSEIEAARAYDAAARLHHGEFAVLNFPEQPS